MDGILRENSSDKIAASGIITSYFDLEFIFGLIHQV